MKRRRQKSSPLATLLMWTLLIVLVAVGGIALYGYLWMQSYLKSDRFSHLVARELSSATQSKVNLEGFTWSNPNAFASAITLQPKRAQGWSQVKADSVQAGLDWSTFRQGVWSVPEIRIGNLEIIQGTSAKKGVELPDAEAETPPTDEAPAWIKRWLPSRTEIGELDVNDFDLKPVEKPGVEVKNLHLVARPGTDTQQWNLKAKDGELFLTAFTAAFRVKSLNAGLSEQALVLHDASATWIGDCDVTARGALPFSGKKPWNFSGKLSGLEMRHLLDAAWQERLSGVIEADYEVNPATLKGKVQIKNGIAQSLPVLDRVADFTRTERLRRIVFDIATADVQRQGETLQVTNLVLQSNGLIRVEGNFTIEKKNIDGEFFVGVTPDTLRWIPGSQDRVFTESRAGSPAGLVWTKVRVSGPIDQPREDLSNRLLAAAGKALILDTPLNAVGTGVGVGVKVLEGGTEVLKVMPGPAGSAVEAGTDLLKSLVPIFGK
jgi:hypothetical protein